MIRRTEPRRGLRRVRPVGLARARVERIAKAASADKQAIYLYFGSKAELFDAVTADRLRVLADVAPITADDLPGYADALSDALVADPGLQRLSQWRVLRFPEASEAEIESPLAKATEIAASYRVPLNLATDLMMIALGAAMPWNIAAERIRNPLGEPEERPTVAHPQAVVTAVTALTDPLTDAPKQADHQGE